MRLSLSPNLTERAKPTEALLKEHGMPWHGFLMQLFKASPIRGGGIAQAMTKGWNKNCTERSRLFRFFINLCKANLTKCFISVIIFVKQALQKRKEKIL